jgi:hypothetical protein
MPPLRAACLRAHIFFAAAGLAELGQHPPFRVQGLSAHPEHDRNYNSVRGEGS